MTYLISARESGKIITSLHLEFTSINNPDTPDVMTVEYFPDGIPDPNTKE